MSIESAKLFIDRMKHDRDFAEKVSNCKDEKSRMEFIKSEGFDFSMNEIREEVTVLNEEDIEFISAGSGSSKCCVPGMEFIQ